MVSPLKIEAMFELIAHVFFCYLDINNTAVIQPRTGLQRIAISDLRVL